MATTESRTGFRLPWSTDRSASREEPAEPAAGVAALADDPAVSSDGWAGTGTVEDAPGDAGREEEPVTTFAPDDAPHSPAPRVAWADDAGQDPTGPSGPAAPFSHPATTPAPRAQAPVDAAPVAAPHRPVKFLADLTRAMQAAAEQSRAATLEQLRAEATAVIEQIHARSGAGGDELRRRADDDVAAIKEWARAETARIRAEAERRVTARREQLDGQLERHAALIEHEIEKVRGRTSSFEVDMGRFFDELLQEEDPAAIAARAASLPEAPSFDDVDEGALVALLQEPGVGTPELDEATPEPVAEVETIEPTDAMAATTIGSEPPSADAMTSDEASDDDRADATMPVDAEASAEARPPEAGIALNSEAAMAAIEAAAQAAEAVEAASVQAERAEAAADRAEALVSDDHVPWAGAIAPAPLADSEDGAAEVLGATPETEPGETEPAETEPAETEPAAADVVAVAPEAEAEIDPRLVMLGLTPNFAAAEAEAAEAAEAAAAAPDDIPEFSGDALAARLHGLFPGDEAAGAEDVASVTTQVVVTGLVSVASIASFKRHLGRLPGVAHVGVSSGPDGEFVFAVEHAGAISLRDLVPTLPGFAARVVGGGDGIMQVTAQDPQS